MNWNRMRSFSMGLACVGLALLGCGDGKPPVVAPLASAHPAVPVPAVSSSADMPKQPTSNTGKGTSDETARGIKALQAGDLAAAKASLEAALKKRPKDAEAKFYLGVTLEKGGDRAGAEKAYREALSLKPDLDEAAANLGALLVDSERFDDAVRVLKSALARRPDDGPLRTNLAVALAGKGDKEAARKAFDDAVKLTPADAQLLLTYGHWLVAWKDNDGAVQKLRSARAAAGDNTAMLASVGHELRLAGAFGDCVPTFDKALASKDTGELRVERALCKMGAKDDAGAMADLQAAVQKDASYAPGHYYLAGRLASRAKWSEVIKEYEAYLKLEPNGPLAKTAQERIKLAQAKAGKK